MEFRLHLWSAVRVATSLKVTFHQNFGIEMTLISFR